MAASKALLPVGLLMIPALAAAESAGLTQLRGAADASERSVYASSLEGARAGSQVWADNAAEAPPVPAGAVVGLGDPGKAEAVPSPNPPRPSLIAASPPVPKAGSPDPVPPKIKGWEGFKMGFLGAEALGLRLLSKTGGLAVPLLILLQPIVLPIALIAGLLGIFGVRL